MNVLCLLIGASVGFLADLGSDYIVEQGKIGVWKYRKCASGVAAGGTVVLHYMPHELVGHYFVEVT